MEPQENKQLALQKAISSHEQAAAGLNDLMGEIPDQLYRTMLERIELNVLELHAVAARSQPGDHL